MAKPQKAINTVISEFRRLYAKNEATPVIALSGGVDSIALLFCVSITKIEVKPVFVFHGIRSKEEELKSYDAASNACIKLGMRNLTSCSSSSNNAYMTEDDARIHRYLSLESCAGSNGVIATAHHADDQLETMIMRLCRGSGIRGLAAIPPSSRIPIQIPGSDCKVIRPMLKICKDDCIEICEQNNLLWHEDVTNKDTKITRNKIRQEVLPILKSLYPKASKHASEAAFKLRDISDLVESRVDYIKKFEKSSVVLVEINRNILREEKDAPIAEYVRDVTRRMNDGKNIDRINTTMTVKLINSIRSMNPNKFDWPGMTIEVNKKIVRFEKTGE